VKHTPHEQHILTRLKAGWKLRAKVQMGFGYAALIKGKVVEEVSYNPVKSLRNKGMISPIVLGAGEREWRLR